MDKTIFNTFTHKNAKGYIDKRTYTPRVFPNFFKITPTAFLNFETLIGSQGRPVAADVIAYGAGAPRKTRKVLSKLQGDIPQIASARELDTKDFNKINQLNALIAAGADGAQEQLKKMVYDDVDFVIEGAYARMEWLCMQAISQGYIALSSSNNDGIITEENIDFQMPAANKRVLKTATSNRAWSASNLTTMTPLVDILDIVESFRSSGIRFKYLLMDVSTALLVRKSTEIIRAIPNVNTAVRIPTMAQVNQVLQESGLPQIIVIDSYVDLEDSAGSKTSTNCWNTSYATFIPDMDLGEVLSGPVAEFTALQDSDAVVVKNKDGVVTMKWSTKEPLKEITKGLWNAFPSFPSIDKVVRLKFGTVAADGLDD
jgi:hypothetical protein